MEWLPRPRLGRDVRIGLARQAVAASPGNDRAWRLLADILLEMQDFAQAAAVLHQAVTHCPHRADLHALLAQAARRAGDDPAAHMASLAAVTMAPRSAAALVERYLALVHQQDMAAADLLVDPLLACEFFDYHALPSVILSLFRQGRAGDAVALGRRRVALNPGDSPSVFWLARALAQSGQRDEAVGVLDLDRFTRRYAMPLPAGYDDLGHFHQVLTAEILNNPSLESDPKGKATRNGYQTLELQRPATPAMTALLTALQAEITAFAAVLGDGDDHPFVRGRPVRVTGNPWAVVYPGQGRQLPHIHPSAWMTAVYYVANPVDPTQQDRGALVLGGISGAPKLDQAPWGVRTLVPQAGEIVLFPGWAPHYSRPTGMDRHRICVPMDVVVTPR